MAMDNRPAKRKKLLDDSDDSSDAASSDSSNAGIKINPEYAQRFEHNKKRQEKERLELKYGKDDESSSSESEDEDEEGELVDAQNDAQFEDTLNALKSRDPRIYEGTARFFIDDIDGQAKVMTKRKDNPVRLRDYHRANLLNGGTGVEEKGDINEQPQTYSEEQLDLKHDLLKQANDESEDEDSNEDEDNEGFLKRKEKASNNNEHDTKVALTENDVERAEEDPEGFLTKFMSGRAWIPSASSKYQTFESEDEDYDEMAERYEDAYNMRYEDPEKANETIKTHSRDAATQFSVRREEATGRKKAREQVRAAKSHEKEERAAEKDRLRRLKIEEAQEKLQQFKEAAGLGGKDIPVEEWSKFLDAGFDDDKWEEEMRKRFNEDYYGAQEEEAFDGLSSGEDQPQKTKSKKSKAKLARPKWNSDIDIGDIIPDFDEEEERKRAQITLTDDEDNNEDDENVEDGEEDATRPRKKSKKDRIKEQSDRKKQARIERQRIEELVDRKLATDAAVDDNQSSAGPFKYRETSPTTFGLSAREILMADDTELNQYAGLKKLAAFRQAEKKKKDKKYYSKKARLKQWRQETFGDETGPTESYTDFMRRKVGVDNPSGKRPHMDDAGGPSKKKRRSRKRAIATGEM